MADEFMPGALSCAGHKLVKTPNLDKLAQDGVRFENAYTPSPMCVPARAAFQAGRHVDKVGSWSSAEPYSGNPNGWGHHLRENGSTVASIGKLHFRSSEDDNGFDPELLALHVADGEGWVPGLLRKDPLPFDSTGYSGNIGGGKSQYNQYDGRICERACDWLSDAPEKPWVLFVSFVSPHYPLVAPDQFYDLYDPETVDMPYCYETSQRPDHPVVKKLMAASGYDKHFDEEKIRIARAAYYGLCSYVDDMVGQIMACLNHNRLADQTRVVFTADHGEMLGNHGAWTKMLMYEDSAGIPMILSGPGIAKNKVCTTPVTLLDIPPMLYADHNCQAVDIDLDGESLASLSEQQRPDRCILSQYHDGWSITGYYMLRWGKWKYIHYPGFDPQLFNLVDDPQEQMDLGTSSDHQAICALGEQQLRKFLDPDLVNDQAFADQAKLIENFGGVEGIKEKMALYFDFTPLSEETS